jgi:hypothetical protein
MSESITIAFAGADREDLRKARFMEVPREEYVHAAHFATRHSESYRSLTLDRAEAARQMASRGDSCEAVLAQATEIDLSQPLLCRGEGPSDTGGGGVAHEAAVAVETSERDAYLPVDEDDLINTSALQALAVEEIPAEDGPALFAMADELSSADIDETMALKKVEADFEILMEAVRELQDKEEERQGLPTSYGPLPEHVERKVASFKSRVRSIGTSLYASRLEEAMRSIAVAEGSNAENTRPTPECDDGSSVSGRQRLRPTGVEFAGPAAAYAVHTGTEPLSMYDPDIWAMCYPYEFPYGDGVFGLPRLYSLTFSEWRRMLLLREELVYDVTPGASDTRMVI